MKVAVIGSGAREHALAWALSRHRSAGDVFVLPGNGGIAQSVPIRADDFHAIERFCKEKGVGLVIVGPEAPLAAGIVDVLWAAGIPTFGPTKAAAQLEASKVFSKRFMQAHGVATAECRMLGGGEDAEPILEALEGRLVVKYDGLAAGKGVWVCGSMDEARAAVNELRSRHGRDARFLVEQRLDGDELSVIGFTDGEAIRLLPASQDHKALRDGDQGPNTGGMGAFSPVPQVGPEVMERVHADVVRPTLKGLRAEGLDFRGFLYFGLMLTRDGPKLLEYNARLGDPEAEVILPLLETDPAEVALACLERRLDCVDLRVRPGAAVSVVLAAPGYPGEPKVGQPIDGLDRLDPETLIFHAATRREGGRLVTSGGRVLNVVARAGSIEEAIRKVYVEVEKVCFEGAQYRRDIGKRTWKLGSNA